MKTSFLQRLEESSMRKQSFLFYGLDASYEKIPICFRPKNADGLSSVFEKTSNKENVSKKNVSSETSLTEMVGTIWNFSKALIDSTSDRVIGVKLQSAYFESLGDEGSRLLKKILTYCKQKGLLTLLDIKRADIPKTSLAYARAYLDDRGGSYFAGLIDAITIVPFFGLDSIEAFAKVALQNGKFVFICLFGSNVGAKELFDMRLENGDTFGFSLAMKIANHFGLQKKYTPKKHKTSDDENIRYHPTEKGDLASADYSTALGFVVGATYPEKAALLRGHLCDVSFLVPGYGAQGGDRDKLSHFFWTHRDGLAKDKEKGKKNDSSGHLQNAGYKGAILPLSRSFMYPWDDSTLVKECGWSEEDRDIKKISHSKVQSMQKKAVEYYNRQFSMGS